MEYDWKIAGRGGNITPKDGSGEEIRLLSEALDDMFYFGQLKRESKEWEWFLSRGRSALLLILDKGEKSVSNVKHDLKKVLIDRYKEYNSRSIKDSFKDTVARYSLYIGKGQYRPQDVCYFMIASKEARALGTPFKYDTFLDIIGYSVIAMCLLDEEEIQN